MYLLFSNITENDISKLLIVILQINQIFRLANVCYVEYYYLVLEKLKTINYLSIDYCL